MKQKKFISAKYTYVCLLYTSIYTTFELLNFVFVFIEFNIEITSVHVKFI